MLTYAIGDIHGCYGKLRNLLDHCMAHRGARDFRLVFLGDYVDRGEQSREVVELLIETQAQAPDRIVCLKGNHAAVLAVYRGAATPPLPRPCVPTVV